MLTTAPYLRVRRPSPTAAEFTVTTLPPPTPALRLALGAAYLARAGLVAAILLFLCAAWAQGPYGYGPADENALLVPASPSERALRAVLASRPGVLASRLAQSSAGAGAGGGGNGVGFAVPLCLLALYLVTRRAHVEESLLVLRGLGIQTSASRGGLSSLALGRGDPGRWAWRWTTRTTTRFIPTGQIRDVLVNEAFRGFEVRRYLVVVVEGEADLVVVFPRLRPRADVVERVWRGVRECLYERGDGYGGMAEGKS
ncbi:GPI-GlcNAc transferase complex, PIG-H component-domain-containing protein [Xylaria palmicola]|nr:GPI-GlcNAc transferase complex, PIG-H component-domain-containing protein [Xylaria palmicola]